MYGELRHRLFPDFLETLESRYGRPLSLMQTDQRTVLKLSSAEDLLIVYYFAAPEVVHRAEPAPAGIRQVHLDEDLWYSAKDKILSRLDHLLGRSGRVYARLTEVRRVSREEALNFQCLHHLNVALPGKYRYALFHRNELIALAVFSGHRLMTRELNPYRSTELLRFCYKSGCTVVGGLTKLLKTFIREQGSDDIMTYADRDWTDGRNYATAGFRVSQETKPALALVDAYTGERLYAPDPILLKQPDRTYVIHKLGSLKLNFPADLCLSDQD